MLIKRKVLINEVSFLNVLCLVVYYVRVVLHSEPAPSAMSALHQFGAEMLRLSRGLEASAAAKPQFRGYLTNWQYLLALSYVLQCFCYLITFFFVCLSVTFQFSFLFKNIIRRITVEVMNDLCDLSHFN